MGSPARDLFPKGDVWPEVASASPPARRVEPTGKHTPVTVYSRDGQTSATVSLGGRAPQRRGAL